MRISELDPACPPIGFALDDERPQALRGGIDGGGEAGRTGADDDQVEVIGVAESRVDAKGIGELGEGGIDQHALATRDRVADYGERRLRVSAVLGKELFSLLRSGVAKHEWDAIAGQQVAKVMTTL